MLASERLRSFIFYLRYGWFQFRERFTDAGSSLAYLTLYPFFIWVLTQMWGKFNSYQGNYTREEIYIYVAITELLFMTFLRSAFMARSAADFSVSLAWPRSWLKLVFSGQIGTTLGNRFLYVITAIGVLAIVGIESSQLYSAFVRLLFLLPILGVLEALMASVLASTQLLWYETRYFVLPITKIFLALGGVFGPLADYGEPGRSIFLKLPASDLFFQVGHFCLRGEFYQMSALEWLARISFWIFVFYVWNWLFFGFARRRHQSYGG